MDKVIVTVMLIIAGIVASLAVFNGIYPAITQSSSAINQASSNISDQIESRIAIVQVSGSDTVVEAWVKNVGSVSILGVENSNIFMSLQGGSSLIPYSGGIAPYWEYQIEGGGSVWGQTGTVHITIHLDTPLGPGIYDFKMVIPNGIYDDAIFSVS